MRFISEGTPGRAAIVARPMVIQMPGAVPIGFARGSAPWGNNAWTRFRPAIGRFRRANIASIAASEAASSTRGTAAHCARASRVRSSCVGPRPPVMMTTSARSNAARKAARWSSNSSPKVVWKATGIPIEPSCWLSHRLLVSRL